MGPAHRGRRGVGAPGHGPLRRRRPQDHDRGADHRRVLRRQRGHRHEVPACGRHPAVLGRRVPRSQVRRRNVRPRHRQPRHAHRRERHGRHGHLRRAQPRPRQRRAVHRGRPARLLPDHEHALERRRPRDRPVRRRQLPGPAGRLHRTPHHLPRPRGRRRGAPVPAAPHALLRRVPGRQRLREPGPQSRLALPRRRRPQGPLPHDRGHPAGLPLHGR